MVKLVNKKDDYQFKVLFSDLPDELDLNFEPLIRFFNLDILYDKFVLCHWQARPKGLRGFGWYDFLTKQYYSIDWNNIQISASKSIPIQINELAFTAALPSAVILYPNAYLMRKGSKWKVLDE